MTLSTTVDKRRRRTRAQIRQLQQQILAVLREDPPQSVRHVFYRMTDPRLPEPVEKSDNGYRHVQYQVTQMRRAGIIPYGWITDATRRGWHVAMFDGPADFIRRTAGLYRADLWVHADHYVEVWAESRSIAAVMQDHCEDLAVSLYPSGGFTSITLAYEAAQEINQRTDYGGIPAEIIYIGDYDPAGVLIDQALERELREHLDSDVELHLHRLAITPEQITAYDLPTKPRKASDRRVQDIKKTVEAEAMPAGVLRRLLRKEIERFLPSRALQVVKAAEESERTSLLDLADRLEGTA
jgi:hypothetical protein